MRRDTARAAQKSDPVRNPEFLRGYHWLLEPPPWPPDSDSRTRRPGRGDAGIGGLVSGNDGDNKETQRQAQRAAAEALFRPKVAA